jgi:hypothetical protein
VNCLICLKLLTQIIYHLQQKEKEGTHFWVFAFKLFSKKNWQNITEIHSIFDDIDESSFDDLFDDNNNEGPEVSVPQGSVVDRYLKKIQDKYRNCSKSNKPDIYKEDTFWIHRKLPAFVLDKKVDPDALYEPKVCLWFPEYFLTENHKVFKCVYPGCNFDMKLNGFNTNPRARKIYDDKEYVKNTICVSDINNSL